MIFKNLEFNELKEIARIQLKSLQNRLIKKDLILQISDDVINELVKGSFDINYGARPLRRIIQKEIETKIANNILENNYLNKKEINVFIKRGKILVD